MNYGSVRQILLAFRKYIYAHCLRGNGDRMKLRRVLLVVLALLLISGFLIHGYVVLTGGRFLDKELARAIDDGTPISSQDSSYDCILVLGAGVYADGTPTPMLRDRLNRGIELYNLGLAPKLLLTGDSGQAEYDEVEVMMNYTLDQGVPAEDIILDHAGFSTFESMYRAKEIFNLKSVIVVTQIYHEYRALYIGSRLGLKVKGIPASEIKYVGRFAREIREVAARGKDFFKCEIEPLI